MCGSHFLRVFSRAGAFRVRLKALRRAANRSLRSSRGPITPDAARPASPSASCARTVDRVLCGSLTHCVRAQGNNVTVSLLYSRTCVFSEWAATSQL